LISFSVIIVAFNNQLDVEKCIASIYQYNDIGSELEVIVVDNSEFNSIELFISITYPEVIYKKNNNRGFGEANNVGAELAKGDIFLFLNADTIIIKSLFRFALKKFRDDESLGLFGVQLVDINYKHNYSYGFLDKYGLFYAFLLKFCQKVQLFIPDLMFISGANIFVKSSAFFEAGSFDEKIFLYYEESDLTRRIKLKGYKIRFFANKTIIHKQGATINIESLKSVEYRLFSYAYYCSKYKLNFIAFCRKLLREYHYKNILMLVLNRNRRYDENYIVEVKKIIHKAKIIYFQNIDNDKV
jgi:GT2 family glycosyltransferase